MMMALESMKWRSVLIVLVVRLCVVASEVFTTASSLNLGNGTDDNSTLEFTPISAGENRLWIGWTISGIILCLLLVNLMWLRWGRPDTELPICHHGYCRRLCLPKPRPDFEETEIPKEEQHVTADDPFSPRYEEVKVPGRMPVYLIDFTPPTVQTQIPVSVCSVVPPLSYDISSVQSLPPDYGDVVIDFVY